MNIIQIINKFPTQEHCVKHIEAVRWQGKPKCPYCRSNKHTVMSKESRYHCNTCNTSYSVTVGTIFHRTHLPLQKWFLAITLILNAKKGISSRQLARDLEVTKDTAWSMQMRVRKAMNQYGELLRGIVEMDETYIGGKDKNKHADKKTHKRGRGTDKTPVVGMAERDGKVKARVQSKDKLKSKNLKRIVHANIDKEHAILMTDDYKGYSPMHKIIAHHVVNHSAGQYVDGDAHTNTIECFWALLKRGIVGQYHQVSKKYLNKYIDEFCFRYNNRKNDNVFALVIENAVRV